MPLDIGIGLIIGSYLGSQSSIPYIVCLLVGVSATLLPDLDYIWNLLTRRKLDSSHRDLFHLPLIFIPTIFVLGLLFNSAIAITLTVGATLHFVHDSFGVGFGIKWLFPFKKNSYLFLFQASTPNNKDMPKQLVYSWNDKERDEMIKKYGYKDWIRHIYFRFHLFGLFEYSILLLGVYVAITFTLK